MDKDDTAYSPQAIAIDEEENEFDPQHSVQKHNDLDVGLHSPREESGFDEGLLKLIQSPEAMRANTPISLVRRSMTSIHSFQRTFVKFSDMCELCGEMIYGFRNNAVRCTSCGFLAHSRCQDSVRVECRHRPPKSIDDDEPLLMNHGALGGAHIFYEKNFTSPEYCNVCRKILLGVRKQGYSCEVCRYSVHESCAKLAIHNCKSGCYTFQEASTYHMTIHHWIEGNISSQLDQVDCLVCTKPVGSTSGLTGFRCAWCSQCIHTSCMDSDGTHCDMGLFQKYIMPPHRVILHDDGVKSEIKYLPDDHISPLVVFINKKSGGLAGQIVRRKLSRLLNPLQIFNLADGGPEPGLRRFLGIKEKIIMVCGGDGTAGWVLQTMDKVLPVGERPPVFVLPLGTGNDLARVLGWGGGYDGEDVREILRSLFTATPVMMDRWKIDIVSIRPAASESPGTPKIKSSIMNNYFSIGVDAKIALNFHKEREAHPEKFTSRARNKLWYGELGAKVLFDGCPDLHKQLVLLCDDVEVAIPRDVEGIIILNIPSYAGGTDLWGNSRGGNFKEQSISDGLLEVIGVTGSLQMGAIRAHMATAQRLAQCKNIKITIDPGAEYPAQVDGEPWSQPAAIIEISFLNQARMLVKNPH
eukprot:TRINITY_DN4266_c0_g2_i4.p1 TRINITY_DN4266_c0_g2~~TRINITY_DN4266_c0_g2_i4.p1  ORF type:complete len:638 (-),score=97.34 TRINITY_DN4266_c0_g2_i4:251-2164(-)